MKLYWQDRWYSSFLRLALVGVFWLALYFVLRLGTLNFLPPALLFLVFDLWVVGGVVFLFWPLLRREPAHVIMSVIVMIVFLELGSSASGQGDITAGRNMRKYYVWGFAFAQNVEEGQFTRLYRQHIGNQLPQPVWWRSSDALGGFAPHGCAIYSTRGVFQNAEAIGYMLEKFNPSVDVKRRMVKDYLSIFQREGEKAGITAYIARDYTVIITSLIAEKQNRLQPSDLPDPDEFARQWLKERYGVELPEAQRDEGKKGGGEQ